MYMFVCFLVRFFCKAASNVGPYGLFWQPALVRCSSMLYLCLLIGRIKMLACSAQAEVSETTFGQSSQRRVAVVKPTVNNYFNTRV